MPQSNFKSTFKITDNGVEVRIPEIGGKYMLTSLTRKARNIIAEIDSLSYSWWQLQSFNISKPFRRQGHGRALLKDALARSVAMEASIILQAQPYDNTEISKEDLVKFYQSMGFSLVDQPKNSFWLTKMYIG